jgi:hypothetical protein
MLLCTACGVDHGRAQQPAYHTCALAVLPLSAILAAARVASARGFNVKAGAVGVGIQLDAINPNAAVDVCNHSEVEWTVKTTSCTGVRVAHLTNRSFLL